LNPKTQKDKSNARQIRWGMMLIYDFLPLLVISACMFIVAPSSKFNLTGWEYAYQLTFCAVCIYGCRLLMGVYRSIWRFANPYAYMRLIVADVLAGVVYYVAGLASSYAEISFLQKLSVVALNLLCCLCMRLMYQFLYQNAGRNSRLGSVMRKIAQILFGLQIRPEERQDVRIKIAIVGAGRVGTMLAEELQSNRRAPYTPACFVDNDPEKVGREVYGLPVLSDQEATQERLASLGVQEIVFALPRADAEKKHRLFDYYKNTGCKIKIYDYPLAQATEGGKRHLREFDIEDLLFRQERAFVSEQTCAYYSGKTILISGGGGSIGSEICRQLAKMAPKKLVILDVYENGAYDIQQELRIAYGRDLNLQVEIASVTDRKQLEKIFAYHLPDVVLHAAAHKHVPLMEHNCCEAVWNNVFGTLNIVQTAEKFGVKKFIMISTDKAVNPTNVMGATKRMCEMIVQSRTGNTSFSATRFGNVLGSNGSVIPLFKRQIAQGGPVTLTDRRIIRYFMTIPEASQLVLQSGAMARNGELFVLDMGKPIKILELAENMIRLTGFEPYKDIDIIETGLREGEKLYEELLIRTEELDKTENSMIFIERDAPLTMEQVQQKLDVLRQALDTGCDETVKAALKQVVPTFHDPNEVNATAQKAREMQMVK
jgi:FlaA1/EpsC-like NDP-sugar epimerase